MVVYVVGYEYNCNGETGSVRLGAYRTMQQAKQAVLDDKDIWSREHPENGAWLSDLEYYDGKYSCNWYIDRLNLQ